MSRAFPARRLPHHHPVLRRRHHRGPSRSLRTSDLVLALLGVVLLGGFALMTAAALAAA
ncbi:hypothetical protein HNR00_004826 [Methylorubrum rhodinum]|uniref:Uncharacterized protein n=1 Tax=Methylorubrum rhodinum TaxID=29428 RepID=A0A840ZTW8_9HYPH|nr:hypothetical protein [Methylorubrum rhodinum]MBB5760083.1 hypothetical protein [Methylorubrum rhodinum]